MHNFFTSDLFFLQAAGAVITFRATTRIVPNWARQLLLILISVYFLTWLAHFSKLGPILAVYVLTAVILGQILLAVGPKTRTLLFGLGCTCCLAILIIYKYQDVIATLVEVPAILAGLHALEWIGLSYLTFRTIDYFISVRPARVASADQGPSWLYGCSYLLFFPAYISGPINRFHPYITDQAKDCTPLTLVRVQANLLRISLGIIKVLLFGRVAHFYSVLGPEFPGMEAVSFPTLALSLYAYFLYYYFDFSGYCDVAVAMADFFEVRLPENFNRPFLASSPQDFWNRWNITLTHWLRDHLFFRLIRFVSIRLPIVPQLPALMVSTFITLAVMGAWHGSSLNWLLYGCYHGFGLCLGMMYQQGMEKWFPNTYERLIRNRAYRGVCIVATFNYVAWGLLLALPLESLRSLLARCL